jgi:carbamoyltransferase
LHSENALLYDQKVTAILGVSALYHDSAAALVIDGDLVAAAQEERFTRVKHDSRIPVHAIAYCLEQANLGAAQLDLVGFYDKPLLKFDRLLSTYFSFAPQGVRSFATAMPVWLRQKLFVKRELRRALVGRYAKRFVFVSNSRPRVLFRATFCPRVRNPLHDTPSPSRARP